MMLWPVATIKLYSRVIPDLNQKKFTTCKLDFANDLKSMMDISIPTIHGFIIDEFYNFLKFYFIYSILLGNFANFEIIYRKCEL